MQPTAASRRQSIIAAIALAAILAHLILRFGLKMTAGWSGVPVYEFPLLAALLVGGAPLVIGLVIKFIRREFGSDLLAGVSIVTAAALGQYLAGTIVVLMLSGGQVLESYAVRSASSALDALARRTPSVAHRREDGEIADVPLDRIAVGDTLLVFPHEICPADGTVVEGHGTMDESYLTGEPYLMSKVVGSSVVSGAINGETALSIRADKLAVDSRYAKIMEVMRAAEQRRPRARRIGDRLGAVYTPVAIAIALLAWAASGDVVRFLAVLVIATPCPLLIAIPIAIIGAVSLCARRGIIIKDPAVLEEIGVCRTAIFDKTGTLTSARPKLVQVSAGPGFSEEEAIALAASVERYSKHPLAAAVLEAAQSRGLALMDAREISEPPGEGLCGIVGARKVLVTSRKKLADLHPAIAPHIPPFTGGMECVVAIDGRYAATFRFRDEPRAEGASFVRHLRPKHFFDRVIIVSGDRESEVRYLAGQVGIKEIYASQTPEQKVSIVQDQTRRAKTVFLGDGINDAPAMAVATVGLAFGQHSEITAEAAGAVILDTSLTKVDEFLHISRRMRAILLQSAVGGMALSLLGMAFAGMGYLSPVRGAIAQELIDVAAVLNALRVALPPKKLTDFTAAAGALLLLLN